jgi:hypothetical protein
MRALKRIATVIGITVLLTGCLSKTNQEVMLEEKMALGSVKITKNRTTNLFGAWEYSSVIATRNLESDGERFASWSIYWICSAEGYEERKNQFWLGDERGWFEVDDKDFSNMLTIAEQDITPLDNTKNQDELIHSIREMAGCA